MEFPVEKKKKNRKDKWNIKLNNLCSHKVVKWEILHIQEYKLLT